MAGSQQRGYQNGLHSSGPNDPEPSFLDEGYDEEAKIIQILDELRECGLDRITDLPQIIVCGSQSAGKSSTLEALSGIHFPSGDDVCTRFVTQVTLKRHEEEFVAMKIIPCSERSSEEKKKLRSFDESFLMTYAGEMLPRAFAKASDLIMEGHKKKFTRDRLCIESYGPKRRPLQLIDLPGITQFEGPDNAALKLVEKLTTEEMQKKQSIILAVVKTTEEFRNAPILRLCGKYDPSGERTIVVATCPDVDSPGIDIYVDILCGKRRDEGLRTEQWHVIKNLSRNEISQKIDRNAAEQHFFSTNHRWSKVPRARCGVTELAKRLREVLFLVAKEELPKMRNRVRESKNKAEADLNSLGCEILGDEELKTRFRKAMEELKRLARDHSRGIYESSIQDSYGAIRLRSRVQDDSEIFRDRLIAYGHSWERQVIHHGVNPDLDIKSLCQPTEGDKAAERELLGKLKRETFKNEEEEIANATKILRKTRGGQLPGFPRPEVVHEIFWALSSNWQEIAKTYINAVDKRCREYFDEALPLALTRKDRQYGFSNAKDIAGRHKYQIEERINEFKIKALDELSRLEQERLWSPRNFIKRFEIELRRYREMDNLSKMNKLLEDTERNLGQELTPSAVSEAMGTHNQENNHKWDPKDFARAAWLHYDIALDQYLTNVIVQVIERHFMSQFEFLVPDEEPAIQDLRDLVKVDAATEQRRIQLESRLQVLTKSLEKLQKF